MDIWSYFYGNCKLLVVMVTGIFASLVAVLERMVPSPEDSGHPSPIATSLLQIIISLITNGNQKYDVASLLLVK